MGLVGVPCTMTFFDLNIKWASSPAPSRELALTLWFKGDSSSGFPDMSFPIDFALPTKKVSYPEISHSKLSPSPWSCGSRGCSPVVAEGKALEHQRGGGHPRLGTSGRLLPVQPRVEMPLQVQTLLPAALRFQGQWTTPCLHFHHWSESSKQSKAWPQDTRLTLVKSPLFSKARGTRWGWTCLWQGGCSGRSQRTGPQQLWGPWSEALMQPSLLGKVVVVVRPFLKEALPLAGAHSPSLAPWSMQWVSREAAGTQWSWKTWGWPFCRQSFRSRMRLLHSCQRLPHRTPQCHLPAQRRIPSPPWAALVLPPVAHEGHLWLSPTSLQF